MIKKLLMLKIAGVLALLGATAGGVAIGVTNSQVAAAKAELSESSPTENQPVSTQIPNPGTDLRNTQYLPEPLPGGVQDFTWDSVAENKEYIKPYAYNLTKRNRIVEKAYYTRQAVNDQTKKMSDALSNRALRYSDDLGEAVYNIVQAIDAENVDGTVAWESKADLKEGQKDIGLIWLEGGPTPNPLIDRIDRWRSGFSDMGIFYYLKEAQFGLYPIQMVGKHGAAATNNFYMQRLRSKDSEKLKYFKKSYEAGLLGNSVLLWAIAGNLDLNLAEVYGAMSLATIIVGTARTSALTKQLYESGFERVSLVGISYGMTLALTMLANDLKLLDSLYRISIGENVVGDSTLYYRDGELSEEIINRENTREIKGWIRGMFDINVAYNIKNMLNSLLRPQNQAIPHQEKISMHVARDDTHNWTHLYDDQEKYFEQTLGIANYQQYELGGHEIWGSRTDMQEWVFGIEPGERRYGWGE